MPNSVSTNTAALSARRYLDTAAIQLGRAQNQLSSGLKSPDPSDDPSGSAITSILTSAISALTQAASNGIQASSLVQLATGTLRSTNDILTRLATLAAQANSDSIDDSARQMLDKEYQALTNQIDQNAKVSWGDVSLFTGGSGKTNGQSYSLTNSTTGIGVISLVGANTANASVTFNQITMSDSSPIAFTGAYAANVTGATNTGATVTMYVGGRAFTYNFAADIPHQGTATFTATDGSGDNFTFTNNSGADIASGGANLNTALNTLFDNDTVLSTQSVVGMSGTVFGSGGSKATSSGTVTSLILGEQTFKIDLGSASIAAGASFVLTAESGDTITLKNGTTALTADAAGATALAAKLNTFMGPKGVLANSGNGNGTVNVAANGLQAVPNAFTGQMDNATTGFISGTVGNIDVTPNGANYDISVSVGSQKFMATTKPTNGGTLVLTSTTDGNNKIVLNYAASVGAITTNATAIKVGLEALFGITAGSPASFTSASTNLDNAQLTPGTATPAGNYVITYTVSGNTGTFKLSDGVNSYTVDVEKAASISETITFDNGMTLRLSAFDGSASIASQATYNVSEGTAVKMLFQIGQQTHDILQMTFKGMTAANLGIRGTNITTKDSAGIANSAVLSAQKAVNSMVADLGGKKSQLDHLQSNLKVSIQNQLAAKATFSDAEITEALMNSQKFQAIVKMATATFQKTLERDADYAKLVEGVLR